MRLLKYQLLLTKFSFFLVFSISNLSTVNGFDFESAVLEALKANPELESQYNQWLASQKKMVQVRVLPEPKLTYTDFLSEVQTRTGPQERILQFSQPFPWPGKLALRGGIANRDAEMVFHQYEALQRDVVKRLADAYYEYAFLGEAIEITEENVSYIEQLIPVIEEKVRGGGRLADLLILEIEKEKTDDRVESLKEQRPIVSSRLQTEMGREADITTLLPFPPICKDDVRLPGVALLEEKLEKHPRVEAASSKVLSFELKKKLAAKASKPDMSLGATIIDIGNKGDTGFGVVLGFSVPIRHHKYQAEIEQAALDKDASLLLKTSVEHDLRSQLHREYQLAKDSLRTALLFKDTLIPKAEQSLAQLEDSYRGNKAGIDEIVDAEKILLQLRLECLRAAAEARRRAVYVRVLTEPAARAPIQATPVRN